MKGSRKGRRPPLPGSPGKKAKGAYAFRRAGPEGKNGIMNILKGLKSRMIEKLIYMSAPGVMLVFGSVFCFFAMVVYLGAGAAWSSEMSGSALRPAPEAAAGLSAPVLLSKVSLSKASPVRADSCPLTLITARDEPPHPASDRNRRSAGKAAALGLVLGVRYALPPAAQAGVANPSALSADLSAAAIARWRDCRKQQALGAL